MAMKKTTIALIAAGLIGMTHYGLHTVYGNEWMTVGYWIAGDTFVYLAYVQDRLFR